MQLSKRAHDLLQEIVLSDNPSQLLGAKFELASREEDEELRSILKELREKGFLSIQWADNKPYYVSIEYPARDYIERGQINRQTPLFGDAVNISIGNNNSIISSSISGNVNGDNTMKTRRIRSTEQELLNLVDEALALVADTKILYSKSNNSLGKAGELIDKQNTIVEKIIRHKTIEGSTMDTSIVVCENSIIGAWKEFHDRYEQVGNKEGMVSKLILKQIEPQYQFYEEMLGKGKAVLCCKSGSGSMINNIGNENNNKVFIVHGHDDAAKFELARVIDLLGFKSIILHEQPDEGKTIIEKLVEQSGDVAFAVVLYTECDLGRAKGEKESDNKYRARQNVVFEHGLFIGTLGRDRVCALVKGDVEKPGDIDGVVYITMDDKGAWKLQLCKNLKAAGLDVDFGKLDRI